MHDLHLANQITKVAQEYARKNGLEKISRLELELGSIVEHEEEVTPEGLLYNLGLLLPDCRVEIKKRIGENYWKLISIA